VLAVGSDARIHHTGYREFPQYFPYPGWVSHDADEIWSATCEAAQDVLREIDAADIVAVGITNQRETTVIWDRATSEPIDKAVVWQCRRTAQRCDALRAAGHEPRIRELTGLVCDAYFSGTKAEWLLERYQGDGDLAFGTIDTWLLWKLTGGRVHATDPSNASRTMLFDIRELAWSQELCDLLHVPMSILPEVRPSSGRFGHTTDFCGLHVPVSGIAGDQQAALFGQGCFRPGRSKNTYGTGSFLLMNTGEEPPLVQEGLLATVAWTIDGRTDYALEGAIFVTGAALNWLRDGLELIDDFAEAEPLASSVDDTDGVVFVPALTGLGSPYWDPYARGTILGLTRGTSKAHLVRAAIEAMAHQSQDVIEAMERACGAPVQELRVDGGAVRMDLLCQLQADISQIPVVRPVVRETTALGAAFLAGLAEGVWDSLDDIENAWGVDRTFEPGPKTSRDRWIRAIQRSLDWEKPDR
jgi:glycerol kinase